MLINLVFVKIDESPRGCVYLFFSLVFAAKSHNYNYFDHRVIYTCTSRHAQNVNFLRQFIMSAKNRIETLILCVKELSIKGQTKNPQLAALRNMT